MSVSQSQSIKLRTLITGACGSVVGLGTVLQAERSRVRFPMRSLNSFTQSYQPHNGPVDYSASNRNEYQKMVFGSKARPARKDNN
jgi:hypothetical protein